MKDLYGQRVFLLLLFWFLMTVLSCGRSDRNEPSLKIKEIPVAPGPFKTVKADFNKDGWDDVALISKSATLTIYFNNGLDFENKLILPTYTHGISLAASDFNVDGHMDIAIFTETLLSFYLGDGKGNFSLFDSTLQGPSFGSYITSTDLTNDGLPDLVATGMGDVGIHLYINRGNMQFSHQIIDIHSGFYSRFLSTADLDGNGYQDIIVPDYIYGILWVVYNYGGEIFMPEAIFSAETTISTAVPLSGYSPLPDLCVALEGTGIIVILQRKDNGGFEEIKRIPVSPVPIYLYTDDLDRDGIDDVIVVHTPLIPETNKGSLSIFFSPAGGNTLIKTIQTGGYSISASTVDWDRDGFPDILVCNLYEDTLTYIPSLFYLR